MVLEPEPLPMVEPVEPEPVLGVKVLLPLLPVLLPLPLVCAWAVEKASAVPAVRRATVRRRENIEILHHALPPPGKRLEARCR
jgi:hypothetical protein